jgi:hypothetical protein
VRRLGFPRPRLDSAPGRATRGRSHFRGRHDRCARVCRLREAGHGLLLPRSPPAASSSGTWAAATSAATLERRRLTTSFHWPRADLTTSRTWPRSTRRATGTRPVPKRAGPGYDRAAATGWLLAQWIRSPARRGRRSYRSRSGCRAARPRSGRRTRRGCFVRTGRVAAAARCHWRRQAGRFEGSRCPR